MRLKVKLYYTAYEKVGDEYKTIECKQTFHCNTYDDLQNLLLTIIEASDYDVKFEVGKENVDE